MAANRKSPTAPVTPRSGRTWPRWRAWLLFIRGGDGGTPATGSQGETYSRSKRLTKNIYFRFGATVESLTLGVEGHSQSCASVWPSVCLSLSPINLLGGDLHLCSPYIHNGSICACPNCAEQGLFQKKKESKNTPSTPTLANHRRQVRSFFDSPPHQMPSASSWANVLCGVKYGFVRSEHKREAEGGGAWRTSISSISAGVWGGGGGVLRKQ